VVEGRSSAVVDACEEHGAESGDADGAGELLDGVEYACAGADLFGGGASEDEVEDRDEDQAGAESG
jgi:hypothetical protein